MRYTWKQKHFVSTFELGGVVTLKIAVVVKVVGGGSVPPTGL